MSLPKISKISLSYSPINIISNKNFNQKIDKNTRTRNNDDLFDNNKKYMITSYSNYNRRKKEVKSRNTQTQFEEEAFPKKINIFSKVTFNHKVRKYIPRKKEKESLLNNEFLKYHFIKYHKEFNYFHVNSNIIKFKNKNKKEIVKNDISLLGILQNQTNSNFNNKYDLKYWTNNQKKKEQIKHCFTLIKKGINLNDIDNMLNGPKEITSYNIQTAQNNKKKKKIDNFSNLKKRIERKNNYNLTVNTLEKIRPLTTFKNIIK